MGSHFDHLIRFTKTQDLEDIKAPAYYNFKLSLQEADYRTG
jgi:hypothetical protein